VCAERRPSAHAGVDIGSGASVATRMSEVAPAAGPDATTTSDASYGPEGAGGASIDTGTDSDKGDVATALETRCRGT
jgi:hypothetical protein